MDDTGRLAEYQSLRQELMQNQQIMFNLIALMLGATGVVLGYGIEKGDGVILLANVVILPSLFIYLIRKRRGVVRLAAYIEFCVEPYVAGLQWETLKRYERRHAKNKCLAQRTQGAEIMLAPLFMFLNLAFSCHMLRASQAETFVSWIFWYAGLAAAIAFAIYVVIVARDEWSRDKNDSNWAQVVWCDVERGNGRRAPKERIS